MRVYESRIGFQELLRAPRQQFWRARFGRKNRGRSRSCASSRARQGQGRQKHAGLDLTNPSYVVRKASSGSLRSTNPSDSGHARLAVRRGTGDNLKNHLDSAARLLHFPKCSGGPRSTHRLVHVSRFRGRRRSSIAGNHRRDAFLQRGPDVRDDCRDDARLSTRMSPLMEPDMSGDRDGKVPADRRTSLLPAIWHRGLEDTISLHRFTEGFRKQRHRSRVAPRPPRGFDPPSRKMYDYLV